MRADAGRVGRPRTSPTSSRRSAPATTRYDAGSCDADGAVMQQNRSYADFIIDKILRTKHRFLTFYNYCSVRLRPEGHEVQPGARAPDQRHLVRRGPN